MSSGPQYIPLDESRLYGGRYKIGDAFFHVPLPQAQEMLGITGARVDEDINGLEEKLETLRDEMTELKVQLYARFGKTINLET